MLKSLARRGRVVLIQLREGITFTWNELKNNKFRTFLSLLGVSIGIFTIVAIFGKQPGTSIKMAYDAGR